MMSCLDVAVMFEEHQEKVGFMSYNSPIDLHLIFPQIYSIDLCPLCSSSKPGYPKYLIQ